MTSTIAEMLVSLGISSGPFTAGMASDARDEGGVVPATGPQVVAVHRGEVIVPPALTEALAAFAEALRRALAAGVPIELEDSSDE